MSARAATPGPWTISPHSMNASALTEILDVDGERIAAISIRDAEGANAALIASAPEQQAKIEALAQALEAVLADFAVMDAEPLHIDEAQAALRLAGRP